jgi:aminoglycoside/choline kinase family phosphotransferase
LAVDRETLIREKIRAVFGQHTGIPALNPLAGDASSRRYFRALLDTQSGPKSVIAMDFSSANALPLSSEELGVFKEPVKELPFLNVHRFLLKIGVRVPQLYGAWESEGILLLEDLGDTSLWERIQGVPETEILSWYKKAIDELINLQVRGTREAERSCIAFAQRFDFTLYMWEFEHFIEYGLVKRVTVAPGSTELLREAFEQIARRLDAQPIALNHRDYHSWNLMIHEKAIAVIDFQDALMAPAQYDLASLLNDRITDRAITPALETALLEYYFERRAEESGELMARDLFLEIYLLSAIQRDLKVVGRFYYLDMVKKKTGYTRFIPPTLRRLKRNLGRLPEFRTLVPVLSEYFEELR